MEGDNPPKACTHENEEEVVTDQYYDDPYDEYGPSFEEQLQSFISSPNPTLMDFTQDPFPSPPLPSPTPTMETNENSVLQELSLSISTIDEFLQQPFDYEQLPMFDLPSNDDLNIINNNSFLGDGNNNNGNNIIGETSRLEVVTPVLEENRVRFANTPTTSEGIHLCSCCNPLRCLVHRNGQEMMRLDIHGGIGFFCHAALEFLGFDGSTECRRQTIHLKGLKMEEVKKYIEDYCFEREVGGFQVVQDTNADFYQAIHACSVSNQERMSSLASPNDVPDEALNVSPLRLLKGKEKRKSMTALALQRERTGKMTLKDLSMYFHLPIEEAAKKMSLCPTVVKKICRKGGLPRWPHRKIKSLQKKISLLRDVLSTATDVGERVDAEMQINRVQKDIEKICSDSLKNCK